MTKNTTTTAIKSRNRQNATRATIQTKVNRLGQRIVTKTENLFTDLNRPIRRQQQAMLINRQNRLGTNHLTDHALQTEQKRR